MPLIIETYDIPYTKISNLLFPGKIFTYVGVPISENEDLFCYTRDIDNVREIKYHFTKIYFVENGKIVGVDKKSQKIRLYDINTGKLIKFTEEAMEVKIDKTEYLPQMAAQSGELVVFPDDEDEE